MGVRVKTLNFGKFANAGDSALSASPSGLIAVLRFPSAAEGTRPLSILANIVNLSSFKNRIRVYGSNTLVGLTDAENRIDFTTVGSGATEVSVASDFGSSASDDDDTAAVLNSYMDVAAGGIVKFAIDPVANPFTYIGIVLVDSASVETGITGRLELVHFEGEFSLRYP